MIHDLSRYLSSDKVIAFVTDKSVDFTLPLEGTDLLPQQKDLLFSYLKCSQQRVFNILQVHGNDVIITNRKELFSQSNLKSADGVITSETNVPIAVRTADCFSIFIYDQNKKIIALIHAGWKGSQKGIVLNALKIMKKQWSSHPQDLQIVIGPGIRQCCYEVGWEFKNYFPGKRELEKRDQGLYLDLVEINKNQLKNQGVADSQIYDCDICTYCDQRFFSYRRQKEKAGRMISVMMLKD